MLVPVPQIEGGTLQSKIQAPWTRHAFFSKKDTFKMTDDTKPLLCDKIDFSLMNDEILEFWDETMV